MPAVSGYWLPVAVLLELFDAAEDEVALEAAEAVDEEDAVEVVDLMEHGAGQQFRTFYFKYFPFDVLRTDFNPGITLDFLVDIRKAEAAFLFELLTAAIDDLGVDKDELIFRSLFKAYVYHCDLLGDAYLRSSKADTLGGVHAVEHLFDELSQFRGELGDRLTLFQQDGVGVFDDRVEFGGDLKINSSSSTPRSSIDAANRLRRKAASASPRSTKKFNATPGLKSAHRTSKGKHLK